MQGNYYDRTRYDIDYSSSLNQQAESTPININVEEYKKVKTHWEYFRILHSYNSLCKALYSS